MLYSDFQGLKLSKLGFGTMRLPLREDQSIDEARTEEMVRIAMENGVNYYDTAYPYHSGKSELVIGKILSRYPRESYFLADKYPGHQKADTYDPEQIFEDQLKKCGVSYFDFYLLHNVCEYDIDVYLDPKWNIIPYFLEQKKAGRIRHLGFSSHGAPENLKAFLDVWGKDMEFCQIQLNYLDWTLQEGEKKVRILNEAGIPIWVMEPVRGGKLASLPEEMEQQLRRLEPERSTASWSLRFLEDVPGVTVILSGMSDEPQMEENVRTFEKEAPLPAEGKELLLGFAEKMKDSVPCTGCRYCCDGCPAELNIPGLIRDYNEAKFGGGVTVSMRLESVPETEWPSACLHCGNCESICPQGIHVPEIMDRFAELQKTLPSWSKICEERAEAARKLAEAAKKQA